MAVQGNITTMTEAEIIQYLKNLQTDKNSTIWDERTQGGAPHKPFLLLSIIDGIEIGWITNPRIQLIQDLIETFFRYWDQVMGEERKTTIAFPFYHMQSEPFWQLIYKDGKQPYKNSPSLGGLMDRVIYAKIDDQLFSMMRDEEGKQLITKVILNTYFSKEVHGQILNIHQINIGAYRYARQLELLAAEPFQKYHVEKEEESYTWQKTQQRKQGFRIKVRPTANRWWKALTLFRGAKAKMTIRVTDWPSAKPTTGCLIPICWRFSRISRSNFLPGLKRREKKLKIL
jgi:putative restriction endonuclease